MPALISEDANCKAHVWVSGGALVDTKALVTWVKTGNPTFVGSSLLNVPNGASAEGVTGFTDVNYWASSVTSDALDFAGDYIVTVIVKGSGTTIGRYIFSDDVLGGAGYAIGSLSGAFGAYVNGTTYTNASIATNLEGVKAHIVTLARSGTTLWLKVDGQPIIKFTGPAIAAATTALAYIGRHSTAGYSWDGTIYEMYATSTTPTAALINGIHQTAGGFGVGGERLGFAVPTAQQRVGFLSLFRRALGLDGWTGRSTSGAFVTQNQPANSGGRLAIYSNVINQPGQTYPSGPTDNLWVARIVFRVLKPSWFYGLHPRGNKARANFNAGMN
jgi:hypothetical protein